MQPLNVYAIWLYRRRIQDYSKWEMVNVNGEGYGGQLLSGWSAVQSSHLAWVEVAGRSHAEYNSVEVWAELQILEYIYNYMYIQQILESAKFIRRQCFHADRSRHFRSSGLIVTS